MTDLASAVWHKSSLSGSGNDCVEVAHVEYQYLVRDSKDSGGAMLSFSPGDWIAFLGRVKGGEFGGLG